MQPVAFILMLIVVMWSSFSVVDVRYCGSKKKYTVVARGDWDWQWFFHDTVKLDARGFNELISFSPSLSSKRLSIAFVSSRPGKLASKHWNISSSSSCLVEALSSCHGCNDCSAQVMEKTNDAGSCGVTVRGECHLYLHCEGIRDTSFFSWHCPSP